MKHSIETDISGIDKTIQREREREREGDKLQKYRVGSFDHPDSSSGKENLANFLR